MPNPTTEFDRLMKQAFKLLYPDGNSRAYFGARGGDCYNKAVKPDFVMSDGLWVDFKLHVTYRETSRVPWRPSPLFSSIRKYIDHPENRRARLLIVFGSIHGSIGDVRFPVQRGRKTLLSDPQDFESRIQFQSAAESMRNLPGPKAASIKRRITELSSAR